ncbi:hypothetical protein KAFR_0F03660 [Kazachstania africana CBS 2517]|uniref:Glycosyltransferase family 32 protein n=1 Tax=Kazachstania africana (strain ATCC 22294 / BCRC 22015 / CBS 2517 / CECT 1963 / NBRC 1671 / NRRL Y-8276) TaxID=1071382 RepID=H2AX62_KAZAF|nr:hypothetical protein KAFR_0F03660 [Kazachstania africana CBS 2517]CCF58962.1 hypothetical protein KAFR_0F03660 [Kazachstania africana CBS 2517]
MSVDAIFSRFSSKRKYKLIFISIVILYTVISIHNNNKAISRKFESITGKIRLPTTSHLDDINLKEIDVQNSDLKEELDLRKQLTMMFPYDYTKPIPRKVWQTWKVGPNSKKFPENYRSFEEKWTRYSDSASFSYSLITDDHISAFLKNTYGEVPTIIEAFDLLPNKILKADFFRYLILYARGGIYSDMDTIPLKALNSWPSTNHNILSKLTRMQPLPENEPGLVVGIEADPDRPDWNENYARRIQFCQWTIQAKPGHPVLREIILNITTTTLNSVENNLSKDIDLQFPEDYNINYRHSRRNDKSVKHNQLKNSKNIDGTDIMNWTGPGIFTDIIFEYLNNLIQNNGNVFIINDHLDADVTDVTNPAQKFLIKIKESMIKHKIIPWEFFSLMTKPVIVDDIMVLPITSFSPDVGHMGAKSQGDEMAFVKHMFSGSWKEDADGNKPN